MASSCTSRAIHLGRFALAGLLPDRMFDVGESGAPRPAIDPIRRHAVWLALKALGRLCPSQARHRDNYGGLYSRVNRCGVETIALALTSAGVYSRQVFDGPGLSSHPSGCWARRCYRVIG